ncbi:hypothetical protein NO2_0572 [Candidatus Termititenax persephonae]|uniref:DUF2442 domain-containing protein n=1 Tax=Candidatus Termititenax persephonae TaxID=2218525 RepID=A0A388TGZ9_9BACT|nr:hypothetical protein NO2_0572 [Candidatus Termititenax persephonae]
MLQPKIKKVVPLKDYKLLLSYETGENKVFAVKPYIAGNWYGELRDISYFKTVHLIPDGTGIAWTNGQDIAPHELYEQSSPL